MATYVITEACRDVKDATCVDVCPVGCIHTTPEAPQYYIDSEVCIACEQCFFVCPVDAIYLDENVPPLLQHYLAINAAFFDDHKPGAKSLTLDEGNRIAAAVHHYAAAEGHTVAVAVLDAQGAPVLVAAMDGAPAGCGEQAANKAYTALMLKVPTHENRRRDDRAQETQPQDADEARWLRVGGGYPLAGGIEIYGAVGVAGCETPQQDVLCCQAALASLRFGGK